MGGFVAKNGGIIIVDGAIASGNGGDGFRAEGGGKIIAPGSISTGNSGSGYVALSGGEIDLVGRSLLQQIGLPEDTDIKQLVGLLQELRDPGNASPAAREEVVKKSGLFAKLGGVVTAAVIEQLVEMAFDPDSYPKLLALTKAAGAIL